MNPAASIRRACVVGGAAVGGLACFVASFYRIAEGERVSEARGFSSIAGGSVLFAVLLFVAILALDSKGEKRRIGLPLVIAVIGAVAFAYGQLFLMLNVFGS